MTAASLLTRPPAAAAGTSGTAGPVGQRRHGWRLLAGALVTVAAAAGFALLHTVSDERAPVLAVARQVPAGEVITAADLRVVELRPEAGVAVVPAGRAGSVVGRVAAVPLLPGALLAPGQVGPVVVPGAGQVVVAVRVALPPAGLSPGSRVRVLVTPTSVTGGEPPALLARPVAATVVEVGAADGTGARTVSLLLAASAGDQVATAAAAGAVSLVLTPTED